MKISYSQYQLIPSTFMNAVASVAPRVGALLKIEWFDGMKGFADLHPWPEFGDEPFEKQISDLRMGKISRLLEQSIWLAKRDAVARKQGLSLYENLPRIKNNYLVTDFSEVTTADLDKLKEKGFSTIKLKMGRDLNDEIKVVIKILSSANFLLRLDFNSLGQWQTYEKLMSGLDMTLRSRIDYVEDPFVYEEEIYSEARKFCKLAVDREYDKVNFDSAKKPPVDAIILKPAFQDVEKVMEKAIKWNVPVTVTSNMDHPVGVSHAVCVAGDLKRKHENLMAPAGCLTLNVYQHDVFNSNFTIQGPYIQKVRGKGIGFDEILNGLHWADVKMK